MDEDDNRCPNCGAPIELSPDTVVLVCGYCGASVSYVGGTFTPLIVECEDKGVIRSALERFVGEKARSGVLKDVKYLVVPFWIVELEAVTKYNGYAEETGYKGKSLYREYRPLRGTIRERVAVAVYGRRFEGIFGLSQVKSILLSRFEAAQPFNPEMVKGWSVIGSELDEVEAIEAAKSRVADEHRRRVEEMATKVFDCYTDAEARAARLILHPVVEARYESGGKSYRVCMDGARGTARPLVAELPITVRGRAARAAAAVASVLAISLAAVVLQQIAFVEDLPVEVWLAVTAGPPLLATAAGAFGAYTATQEHRVLKSAGEADVRVLGGL
ncbi:hypothetical protein HRbin02_01601 [Candidatus Calditenuaceae archaeon HR02]|nr:hypothetical protein HRbin02_01601 [Candidatus Calditenuaceae archaeon HR02]